MFRSGDYLDRKVSNAEDGFGQGSSDVLVVRQLRFTVYAIKSTSTGAKIYITTPVWERVLFSATFDAVFDARRTEAST